MAIEAMALCWKIKNLNATERLMLLRLADHADEDFKCWPSQRRLAEALELTRETVNRTIAKLTERGLIRKAPRYDDTGAQKSNDYYLILRDAANAGSQGCDVDGFGGKGVTPASQAPGDAGATGGCDAGVTQNHHLETPLSEPSKNTLRETDVSEPSLFPVSKRRQPVNGAKKGNPHFAPLAPAVEALKKQGCTEQQARMHVGNWLKRAGNDLALVQGAVDSGLETGVVDLNRWVYRCIGLRQEKADAKITAVARHQECAAAVSAILDNM